MVVKNNSKVFPWLISFFKMTLFLKFLHFIKEIKLKNITTFKIAIFDVKVSIE